MPNGAFPELGLEGPKLFSCQDPRERRMRWCWGAVGVELGVRGKRGTPQMGALLSRSHPK